MKDRKTLGHNDLINEATKLLASRFSPQPQMIKRRIEQLIEVRGQGKWDYASCPKISFRKNTLRECQLGRHTDIS